MGEGGLNIIAITNCGFNALSSLTTISFSFYGANSVVFSPLSAVRPIIFLECALACKLGTYT